MRMKIKKDVNLEDGGLQILQLMIIMRSRAFISIFIIEFYHWEIGRKISYTEKREYSL